MNDGQRYTIQKAIDLLEKAKYIEAAQVLKSDFSLSYNPLFQGIIDGCVVAAGASPSAANEIKRTTIDQLNGLMGWHVG